MRVDIILKRFMTLFEFQEKRVKLGSEAFDGGVSDGIVGNTGSQELQSAPQHSTPNSTSTSAVVPPFCTLANEVIIAVCFARYRGSRRSIVFYFLIY